MLDHIKYSLLAQTQIKLNKSMTMGYLKWTRQHGNQQSGSKSSKETQIPTTKKRAQLALKSIEIHLKTDHTDT